MNTNRFEQFITISVVLMASVAAVYFWQAQHKLQSEKKESSVRAVLQAVEAKAEVPRDETPLVSVLTNEDLQLKEGFFLLAEADDRVIVYPRNKVAVLYRPGNQKVISMTTLDSEEWGKYFGLDHQVVADTEGVFRRNTDPLKVTVMSHITEVEQRGELIRRINKVYPSLVLEEKNREQTTSYPKTLVADLSAENGDLVDALAELAHGEVIDQSPPGEITPEADILILLGQSP